MFDFFFKQKTAYELRISDWSSDVCSSDLPPFDCREGYAATAATSSLNRRRGPARDTPRSAFLRAARRCARIRTRRRPRWRAGRVRHRRADERRVGKECVRTVRSRWLSLLLKKTKRLIQLPY